MLPFPLPLGLTVEDLMIGLAALAAFASVFGVWNALLVRDPVAPQLKRLEARRSKLRADATTPRRQAGEEMSRHVMRRVVKRFDLMNGPQTAGVRARLARAGWRSRDAIVAYLFFKLSLPIAGGSASAFLFYGLELYDLPDMVRLMVSLAGVIVGAYAPEVWVKNHVDKRKAAIKKSLPDALDLMVICAEAGLSLDAAFARVSREMAEGAPEMADEIGLTSVELGFLPERRQALMNLNERTDLAPIRGVVNTLLQTEAYGTPLSQSLRVLAAEFRNERLMKAEEKAARLPAIMTVPMIVFILPSLFVVLIGPAALRTFDSIIKAF